MQKVKVNKWAVNKTCRDAVMSHSISADQGNQAVESWHKLMHSHKRNIDNKKSNNLRN